jgi:8-oxo-dGTP pyrophosphatase MutT (NUDIX family)
MKNTKWKRFARKILLKHPRLTIYEDEVELPNGHKTTYIHHANGFKAVMVIAKRGDGKILLQREYSYPTDQWLYQFPGGGVGDNEDIVAAANRELAEEGGYNGSLTSLGNVILDNRRSDTLHSVFLAVDLVEVQANGDAEEDIESYWLSEEEIDNLIKNGDIINGSALAGWALYKANLKQ